MFADVGQGDQPGYGVYKTTSQNDEQIISSCFSSDLGYDTSCQVSQVSQNNVSALRYLFAELFCKKHSIPFLLIFKF